jgi:hypothetical protein
MFEMLNPRKGLAKFLSVIQDGVHIPVVRLDGTATPVTIPGSVEINNDTGNPIPVVGMDQLSVAATIAAGAALSGDVDLAARRAVRLVTPAAWSPAAALTFQVSYDGITWGDLYDETGTEVSYTLVAGKSLRLPVHDWLGIRYLRLRSGPSSAPVNQAAARAFVVVAQ